MMRIIIGITSRWVLDMRVVIPLIGLERSSNLLQAFRNSFPAHWPDATQPDVRPLTVEEALEHVDTLPRQPVVIYLDPRRNPIGLSKLLDALHRNLIPILIVSPDPDRARWRITDDEIIICSDDERIDLLIMRLHALSHRQITVDRLGDDLETNRRFQGGLQGEMARMEEELRLAAMIQREFLPKTLPRMGDIEFGVFFRPACYVSGDVYNIERLDEHTIGFFVADAVGHGVPAALMTMVINHSLIMKEISKDSYRIVPPAEVLSRLNDAILVQNTQNGRFATAVYGTLNTETNLVTIAVAGHPAPMRVDTSGERNMVSVSGSLLGVFAEEQYDEETFYLGAGERLVIYSDGFETAFPADNTQSCEHSRRAPTDRYLDRIRRLCQPDINVDEAALSLGQQIDSQAGSLHQIDDLTAVFIACTAKANEAAQPTSENQAA